MYFQTSYSACFTVHVHVFTVLYCRRTAVCFTVDVHLPTRMFYDDSISYHDVERLGGVATHIRRELKQELHTLKCQRLGVDPSLSQHRSKSLTSRCCVSPRR